MRGCGGREPECSGVVCVCCYCSLRQRAAPPASGWVAGTHTEVQDQRYARGGSGQDQRPRADGCAAALRWMERERERARITRQRPSCKRGSEQPLIAFVISPKSQTHSALVVNIKSVLPSQFEWLGFLWMKEGDGKSWRNLNSAIIKNTPHIF